MGYRSDVRCLIYGSPEQLDALIAEVALLTDQFPTNPFEAFKANIKRTSRKIIYGSDTNSEPVVWDFLDLQSDGFGWKWYPGYDDVEAWGRLMEHIDDCNDEREGWRVAYEFVRVGENDDDVERESSSNSENYLSTTTSIVDYLDEYTQSLEDQNEQPAESPSAPAAE